MMRQRPNSLPGRAALAARLSFVFLVASLLAACAPLTPLAPAAEASLATQPAVSGVLALHADAAHASLSNAASAYWLLDQNEQSLDVRIALAELATETLDLQYFIWQEDATGRLLLEHVIAAADRGVRVRLLLDDLAIAGRDWELAALDAHPRIEVRVFNPWKMRSPLFRPAEFVARMDTLNHRMHNKVYIADGRFGIVGGRNIGDRYFGVWDEFVQNDVDLMVAGPLLEDILASFETYWTSPLSQGIDAAKDPSALLERLRATCAAEIDANAELLSAFEEPPQGWAGYFREFVGGGTSGPGELYLDAPDVDAELPTQLYERFKSFVSSAQRELILSSPYFVPDATFVQLLDRLVERGVHVQIVTNSLASNSHVVAHSAYKKWRRALLETGVELYEMRPDAAVLETYATPPARPGSLALHTKAAVVDGRWSFVGSPNVDPRSMILNTEIGIVADDPDLAERLTSLLRRDMEPENAWRVTLEEGGWLKWWNGDESVGRQPAMGFQQRAVEFFLNLLPIKNQT